MKLKQMLYSRFGSLSKTPTIAESELVKETSHWLEKYPEAYGCYISAIEKCKSGTFERNLLDNLRLSLELLLRSILSNEKSLENQLSDLGIYQETRGMSKEVTNMLLSWLSITASIRILM